MNKQQRDYAIERIKTIAADKLIRCQCDIPSLEAHIRRAIAAEEAKLKSPKQINVLFIQKIYRESRGWNKLGADVEELYEPPQSYKDAMALLEAEHAKHEEENNNTQDFAQSLIDRIQLGEFEDGKEPIRLMEAYTPKPITKSAKKK